MKKKISKVWGVGMTFMLAVSLMLVAASAQVSAAESVINEWDEFSYPDPGEDGDWFRDADIEVVGPMAKAIDGTLYTYVKHGRGDDRLMKSDDSGRTWEETDYADDLDGGAIVANGIVCSSLDVDTLYVTDGDYVYKSDDAGADGSWSFVARADLEKYLAGACGVPIVGRPITCLDVGYDANEDPFVFIGVWFTDWFSPSAGEPDILYIAEDTIGAQWIGLDLGCYGVGPGGYTPYSIGVTPDFATDSTKLIAVVSDSFETHVIGSTLGICGWSELAELCWNCITANSFGILSASRIGFPDDYEDTETVFVGVNAIGDLGGDVYSVTKPNSIDRNVEPGEGGCIGDDTNILSLDICGDTDEASLIAGASDDNTVYYSTDGGWEWDDSNKDPTGDDTTFVMWAGDDCGESALAATSGCECAVSLSCGEEVGKFWNQISLIATEIDCVKDLDHSPGYLSSGSKTMFMLTECDECCGLEGTTSLLRYDGTNWERVFCNTTYRADILAWSGQIEMVNVSPDFGDTATVFVANTGFDIFRSQDAGCEWKRLAYPCEVINITSWAVLDESTVYVGGYETIYKTERHGSRPWDECVVEDDGIIAGDIKYFGISENTILVGDDQSQVLICVIDPEEDWADQEWNRVGEALVETYENTSVAFDPGYAKNNTIHAAAGYKIFRCKIDWDEDWKDQEWKKKCSSSGSDFWGIVAVGNTMLYVGDRAAADTDDGGLLRRSDTCERVTEGLAAGTRLNGLQRLTAGENGCPDSNILWAIEVSPNCSRVWFYEDTLATPVILTSPADEAKLTQTTSVTLEWEALCDAECYQIYLYRYCAECPDEKLYILKKECLKCYEDCIGCSGETCCLVVPVEDGQALEPGTTYYWKVRVYKGEPTRSKWSEKREFTTALPVVPFLCSPECGADGVILTPNFSWTAVEDATGYEVQIATDEDFTDAVSGTIIVNAWVGAPELEYDTVYYWRVRAIKDGVYSDWSVCIFTTEAEPPPEVWTCSQCGLEFASQEALEAHIAEAHGPPATPAYIWIIIAIGALLVIAVLILIVRTRRVV